MILLFVTDNLPLAEFLHGQLSVLRPNWEIIRVGSHGEANKALDKFIPTLALIDLELSDGCAWDLLFELRQKQPHLPLLLISTHKMDKPHASIIKRARCKLVEKPYDIGLLVASVEQTLKSQTVNQQTTKASESSLTSPSILDSPKDACNRNPEIAHVLDLMTSLLLGSMAFGAHLKELGGPGSNVEELAEEYLSWLAKTVMEISQIFYEAGKPAASRT